MNLPSGSEQVLSLAWALENVAGLNEKESIERTCEVVGIPLAQWEHRIEDRTWFISDADRQAIENAWNAQYSARTNVWLDENVWSLPLWQLWLTNPKMVFAANLLYLIKVNGRGTVARLAEATKRNRTTVSKWGRWKEQGRQVRLPPKTVLLKILEFFDLRPTYDLSREPLFLGHAAIHDTLLRNQGKHYLDCLSGEHLRQAVERLREESARQAARRLGHAE